MGSKSYSTTSTDSSANTAAGGGTLLQDSGNVSIGASRGAQVSISSAETDYGAIASAFGFAGDASRGAFDTAAAALGQVGDLAKAQTAASAATTQQIGDLAQAFQSNGESRTQNTVVLVAGLLTVVGVIGVVAWAWHSSGSKKA